VTAVTAREGGPFVSVDDDLGAAIAKVDYLRASIGETGMLVDRLTTRGG
jgi:hypothetical protein